MKKKPNITRSGWEIPSSWGNVPMTQFEPLLSFANEGLQESNWRDTLWHVMGKERLYLITRLTSEGTVKQRTLVSEIAGEDLRTCDVKPELPKIFGHEPTFELVKDLQTSVRKIIEVLATKTTLIAQRQLKGRGMSPRLVDLRTGIIVQEAREYELDSQEDKLPCWWFTHDYV